MDCANISPYVYSVVTDYAITETRGSRNTFTVETLPDHIPLFLVKGRVISFKRKKTMSDSSGNVIFTSSQDLTTWREATSIVGTCSRDYSFSLAKKGCVPGRGRDTLLVSYESSDKSLPCLEIKSDSRRRRAVVTDAKTSAKLAFVARNSPAGERAICGNDSYVLRVAPGVDVSLMAMLTVAYDEQYAEFDK